MMKHEMLEKKTNMANHQFKTTHPKPLTGSTADKYAVILDGGRTIIFISDRTKEAEIRERYAIRNR